MIWRGLLCYVYDMHKNGLLKRVHDIIGTAVHKTYDCEANNTKLYGKYLEAKNKNLIPNPKKWKENEMKQSDNKHAFGIVRWLDKMARCDRYDIVYVYFHQT